MKNLTVIPGKCLSSNAGMFSRFSLVNTLQKKELFSVVALSSSDLANLFLSSRSAIPLSVFNLLLHMHRKYRAVFCLVGY